MAEAPQAARGNQNPAKAEVLLEALRASLLGVTIPTEPSAEALR